MDRKNPVDIFEESGEKVDEKRVIKEAEVENWVDEIVGTFCDPIVVWPSPWQDTLPKDILGQVTIERLLLQMQYHQGLIKEMTATDAEALLYLYPACLEFPFDETWTQIYVYLGSRVCGRMGREVPEDLRGVVLTTHQQDRLKDLKRWIYATRLKRRKEKLREGNKAEKKAEKEELESVQHSFDLFEEKEDDDE